MQGHHFNRLRGPASSRQKPPEACLYVDFRTAISNIGSDESTHIDGEKMAKSTHNRALIVLAGSMYFATPLLLADTIHVPAEASTIQSAIEAATDGDRIVVAPGIYSESLRLWGKEIRIESSAGPERTIIMKPDATGYAPTIRLQDGETPNTVVSGFTIRNGSGDFTSTFGCNCDGYTLGGGLFIKNASPIIENCTISANRCGTYFSRGGGIYVEGGSPLIDRCRIIANEADGGYGSGGGIHVQSGAPVLTDCVIRGNSSFSYHSANCGGVNAGNATLINCIITGNSTGGSIGGICTNSSTSLQRVYIGASNSPNSVSENYVDNGGNVVNGDCNGNGQPDHIDIADGMSLDQDSDGLPDECLCDFSSFAECCIGDLNRDQAVNAVDLGILIAVWKSDGSIVAGSDLNADGLVGPPDLGLLLGAWGACP